MKTLNILHLGIGNVGKEVIKQISENRSKINDLFEVDLNYCGLFTSQNGIFNKNGLLGRKGFIIPSEALRNGLQTRSGGNDQILDAIDKISLPFILIDTTASDQTLPLLKQALEKDGYAVLSNKKPLTVTQKDFDKLQVRKNHILYETTVGAGLPVINTLKTLLATGDEIIEIQGCLSGTLGYIFSELENGKNFSDIVIGAKEKGYTEPDPRDDLSGIDVARKALILSRIIGRKLDLQNVYVENLFPSEMENLSIDNFLLQLPKLDAEYRAKINHAQKDNKVLRYVATITPDKCTVGLQTVAKNSDIGNLQGPDNIIVFKTKRYNTYPIVIKGPGAGIEVTAAGVFADVIEIVKRISI